MVEGGSQLQEVSSGLHMHTDSHKCSFKTRGRRGNGERATRRMLYFRQNSLAAAGQGRGSGVMLDGSGCEYWQFRFWK